MCAKAYENQPLGNYKYFFVYEVFVLFNVIQTDCDNFLFICNETFVELDFIN